MEVPRFRWRKLVLTQVLGSSWMQTRENLLNAFQHSKEEHLCIYFPDFEFLRKLRMESEILYRVWGVLHEMFLDWNRSNLLIIKDSEKNNLPGEILITY